MNNDVLIPNFFRVGSNGDKSVRKCDLGWSDSIKKDAQSDYPETIFRYIVEIVGLNVLFDIWDNLRIDGVPIGEVLEESVITDLD